LQNYFVAVNSAMMSKVIHCTFEVSRKRWESLPVARLFILAD
jgi:hypothetical protein